MYEPEPGQENRDPTEDEKDETYEELKNADLFKKLRTGFPLNSHKVLLESCVFLEMYNGESGADFHELMDAMVMRLKYRYFFDPPLVFLLHIMICIHLPRTSGVMYEDTFWVYLVDSTNMHVASITRVYFVFSIRWSWRSSREEADEFHGATAGQMTAGMALTFAR